MAAGSEVRLLGAWASPFVMRPRIALNIKSVQYEFLQEQFGSKSELLLKSNPVHKKIPVLIHNGKPICESMIIVEYIDEVWPSGTSILPSDPYDRAIARFWAAYVDEKWFPSLRGMRLGPEEEAKKAARAQVEEGLALMEKAFVECSKGRGFFGGDSVGLVDIALGCHLGWLRVAERMEGMTLLDESKTPNLAKWAENFSSDPAVKSVMPRTDDLVEFAKMLQAKVQASK